MLLLSAFQGEERIEEFEVVYFKGSNALRRLGVRLSYAATEERGGRAKAVGEEGCERPGAGGVRGGRG